jgi:hypothetical protein
MREPNRTFCGHFGFGVCVPDFELGGEATSRVFAAIPISGEPRGRLAVQRGSLLAFPAASSVHAAMSLINDALIKAERDRAEEAAARTAALRPHERLAMRRQARKTRSLGFAIANTAALVVVFAVMIIVFVRNHRSSLSEPAPGAAPPSSPMAVNAAANSSGAPDLTAPIPAASPASVQEPIALPNPPSPPYELAGMSALGKNTLLSILRRSDHRSVWVPVGKTVGEITAVSYDAQTDKAVIRVDDELFTLSLRTGAANEPPVQAAE